MRKIVIMIGGCQFNRGSEAMVRGCVRTLRSKMPDAEIVVSSRDDNTGKSLHIEGVDRYIRRFTYDRNNKLLRYSIGVLRYILHFKHWTNWMNHHTLLKECETADLTIVVGGDNYDKAYGAFADMHSFNKTLRRTIKGKMVFLNCSMNPEELDDRIIEDLKLFDKVTAREIVTYTELKKHLPDSVLEYYPDIAFAMEPKSFSLPECFSKGDVVGVNLSPLILRSVYTDNSEVVLQEYYSIIDYVLDGLKKQVLLVPHVMNGADLSVLKQIYQKYEEDERVTLFDKEDATAPELKYMISNCYMYLGARTHSTIAAYGTCVPTLVLGYSVKSIGIARDLFGTEKRHVVPVQSISQTGELLKAFQAFAEDRESVLMALHKVMPEYLEKVNAYGDFFAHLIGGEYADSK